MAKRAKARQPLGVGAGTLQIRGHYRAGMYAELQKFGRGRDELKQLALLAGIEEPGSEVEVSGLALSVVEDKALSAIQILLDRTSYQGNMAGYGEEQSETFHWKGSRPRIAFTWEEYYQAYGLEPDQEGQYRGKGAIEARAALESLAEPRRITYKRPRWMGQGNGRKKVYDVILASKPLIDITTGYKGVTEQEAREIEAGADKPTRVTRLLLDISPLLIDQLDTFYLLKPEGLHKEIEHLLGGKRYSEVVPRFLSYLLTKNTLVVRVDEKTLIQRLRMDHLMNPKLRQGSRVRKRLEECCQIAFQLGYLLDKSEKRASVYTFRLNPEKCLRAAEGAPEEPEIEDLGGTL